MTAPTPSPIVIVTDAATLRQIMREEMAALAGGNPAPIKLAYTIAEAVEVSGCTDWDIRCAIKRGELHAKGGGSRGGKYIIHREHLDNWLRGIAGQKTTRKVAK